MLQQITLETAQQVLRESVSTLEVESVPINVAMGRILAHDLVAEQSLPPYPQSAVDGFALGDGEALVNTQFKIAGYLDLDEFPVAVLGPGQAMGVMTGGTLPQGTLAVVPHERTVSQENILTVHEQVKPFGNIKKAGEDVAAGALLLPQGTRINAGCIALLAALGITRVSVYRKPRVAIISLGKNVIPYQQIPAPGQARDCNTPMLQALVERDGGMIVASGLSCTAEDTLKALWEQADLLIATGSTYTMGGDGDEVIAALKARPLYRDVRIMPGSHSCAARCGSRLYLSLSGNPGACAVGYHLFASPVLCAMQGHNWAAPYIQARCVNGLNKKTGSRRFVRARAVYTAEGWEATILPGQKPSMIRSLISCNALIDVPANSPPIAAGTQVSVMLLDNLIPVQSI